MAWPSAVFIKARILIGCVGAGFFVCRATQGQHVHEIISLAILSLVLFYGVVQLQNKYLVIKDR